MQRYLFNFAEPYLFDTPVSFGLSGYYFNRYYREEAKTELVAARAALVDQVDKVGQADKARELRSLVPAVDAYITWYEDLIREDEAQERS